MNITTLVQARCSGTNSHVVAHLSSPRLPYFLASCHPSVLSLSPPICHSRSCPPAYAALNFLLDVALAAPTHQLDNREYIFSAMTTCLRHQFEVEKVTATTV